MGWPQVDGDLVHVFVDIHTRFLQERLQVLKVFIVVFGLGEHGQQIVDRDVALHVRLLEQDSEGFSLLGSLLSFVH